MANVLEVIISAKDQASREIGKVKGGLKDLGAGLKDLSIAVGAVYGPLAAGLGYAMKVTVDYGAELDLLRQKTGLSTESLSRLGYAAEQEGASMVMLGDSLKYLGKRMTDTEAGLATAKRAFDRMGLSVHDSEGNLKGLEQMLLEVAEEFPKLSGEAEKTGVAMDLFGTSGANLIPLLSRGREGIEELAKEAEGLGIVMSTQTAKSARELSDKMTTMKEGLRGAAIALGTELMPYFQQWADIAIENLPAIIDFAKGVAAEISKIVEGTRTLLDWWGRLGGGIGEVTVASERHAEGIRNTIKELERQQRVMEYVLRSHRVTSAAAELGIKTEEEARRRMAATTKGIAALKVKLAKATAQEETKAIQSVAKAEESAVERRKESVQELSETKQGLLTEEQEGALEAHEAEAERVDAMRDKLIDFYMWQAEQRELDLERVVELIERRLEFEEEGSERFKALKEAEAFFRAQTEQELSVREKEIFQSTENAFAKGIKSMMQGTAKLGEVMKSVWMSVTDKILEQIAEIIAAEIAATIKTIFLEAKKAKAKMITAHAGIPFIGLGIGLAAAAAAGAAIMALAKFERGGVVTKPTLALVGERGPERVMPITGAEALAPAGAGMVLNVTINGTFLEADETKWTNMFRDSIIPEIDKYLDKTGKTFA